MPRKQAQQYSDLPQGAVVMSAPTDQSAYSDLPPGAEVMPGRVPESGATISAAPPSGLTHPINWLNEAESDLKYGGGKTWLGRGFKAVGGQPLYSGTSEQAADVIAGPILGTSRLTRGLLGGAETPLTKTDYEKEHPIKTGVRNLNNVIGGAGQAATLPLAATQPEFLARAAIPATAGAVGSKATKALGGDQDTQELVGNLTGIAAGGIQEGGPGLLKSFKEGAPNVSAKAGALGKVLGKEAVSKVPVLGRVVQRPSIGDYWKAVTAKAPSEPVYPGAPLPDYPFPRDVFQGEVPEIPTPEPEPVSASAPLKAVPRENAPITTSGQTLGRTPLPKPAGEFELPRSGEPIDTRSATEIYKEKFLQPKEFEVQPEQPQAQQPTARPTLGRPRPRGAAYKYWRSTGSPPYETLPPGAKADAYINEVLGKGARTEATPSQDLVATLEQSLKDVQAKKAAGSVLGKDQGSALGRAPTAPVSTDEIPYEESAQSVFDNILNGPGIKMTPEEIKAWKEYQAKNPFINIKPRAKKN